MGRAPCCEKMGLKKGPWTSHEDHILISYIQNNGHDNWRALPKLAGLLRCGKSCRLRWMNYLRPDIRRGNFSNEEEEEIMKLHQILGNRWSTIAARLPGRTDNEIKNVWHTHLKKKLKCQSSTTSTKSNTEFEINDKNSNQIQRIQSPETSSTSDMSNVTTSTNHNEIKTEEYFDNNSHNIIEIDESFWSDEILLRDYYQTELDRQFAYDSNEIMPNEYSLHVSNIYNDADIEFWYDLFIKAGDGYDLPQF